MDVVNCILLSNRELIERIIHQINVKWKIMLSLVFDIRNFYVAEPRGIHLVVLSLILMDGAFFDMESLVRFTSRWWHPQILYKHKSFAPSSLYVAFLMIVTVLQIDNREFFIGYLSSVVQQFSLSSSCDRYKCFQLDIFIKFKLFRHKNASEESSFGRNSLVVGTRCKRNEDNF